MSDRVFLHAPVHGKRLDDLQDVGVSSKRLQYAAFILKGIESVRTLAINQLDSHLPVFQHVACSMDLISCGAHEACV